MMGGVNKMRFKTYIFNFLEHISAEPLKFNAYEL